MKNNEKEEIKRKYIEKLLKIATPPLINGWIEYDDELKKKTKIGKALSPDYPFIYFFSE